MGEWIKTTDKLPEPFVSVLMNTPSDLPLPTVHEGYLSFDDVWISLYGTAYTLQDVTHWMPMPKAPKKEGEANG